MNQEQKAYKFNSDRIKDIALDKYNKDFTFIVNNHKYETSRVVADLLSPIINNYHYQDGSINEFLIKTNNSTENDYFTDFLKLPESNQTDLDDTRRKLYSEYFLKLGNIEEFMKLGPEYTEKVTVQNVIDRLKTLSTKISPHIIQNFESLFADLVKFCSEHFFELPREEIESLDADTLEMIISNDFLRLETEDSLIEILLELNESDKNYSNLFEYVLFYNLKDETIEKFIKEFNINFLTSETWISVCRGLLSKNNDQKTENNRYCQKSKSKNKNNVVEIHQKEGLKFEGLMRYLTSKTGGNIHDNGTIEITSNSIWNNNNNHHPKKLVEYDNDSYYDSNCNDINTYIRFDFKDKKVQVESYTIQSIGSGPNYCHLRNWVVEVSNDCQKWEIIDQHSNDPSLNGSNIISTFQTIKTDSFYRFIQIRQTGYSWDNNDYRIYFPYLEFYGKIELQSV